MTICFNTFMEFIPKDNNLHLFTHVSREYRDIVQEFILTWKAILPFYIITIPDSVTSIVLYGWFLRAHKILDNGIRIGSNVLSGFRSFTSVFIPTYFEQWFCFFIPLLLHLANIFWIVWQCLSEYIILTYISIPNSISIIGYRYLGSCASLIYFTELHSFTHIGDNFLSSCRSLNAS